MFTKNESKVIRYLLAEINNPHSINQIAKECGLSPNGAYKILQKLENEGILKHELISNIKSFKIDFKNEKTKNFLQLILTDKLEGRVKYRFEDLKSLKDLVKICILFGSYATQKAKPKDLDLLIVLEKKKFKRYKEELNKLKNIIPVKVHDVLQTKEDLKKNLKDANEVVKGAIKRGVVLWGQDNLIEIFAKCQ